VALGTNEVTASFRDIGSISVSAGCSKVCDPGVLLCLRGVLRGVTECGPGDE
jgi:hypothetical protein